ncbi:hypothetical protein [Paraburkholderia phytofirmans]|uniref:hypothetical protein n=1 Tax=Paraburkholderia phytofirmans TaxID=261302 RepID=UPI0011DF3C35|nr:hypothetical protein [Paraburkholderia phytofirmans]
MSQEITPLSICLPPGLLEALRKKAKRIQRKCLTPDGQREKLSTVHDLVARCLGYRSYSDMHRWSDESRWPVLDEPEALRKGRQRMRELQCLSEAFPHIARDSIERLADQLALANWEVIEQCYHDKILGWKSWARSQGFVRERPRDTPSPYKYRSGDKIADYDRQRLVAAHSGKVAMEPDESLATHVQTASAGKPPPLGDRPEERLGMPGVGKWAPLAAKMEAGSTSKPAAREPRRNSAAPTHSDALPESHVHGMEHMREEFDPPADWPVARRGTRSTVFDPFSGNTFSEENAHPSTPRFRADRASSRPRAQVQLSRATVPALVDPLLGLPLPPAVDTTAWKTTEPPLIFMPPTMWFASAKARALCDIDPSITSAVAHALTARSFGFTDWFDLDARFKPGRRGRFDNELEPDIRRDLHRWQTSVLQLCLGLTREEAVKLRVDWHPTAETLSYARSTRKPVHEPAKTTTTPERRTLAKGTLRLPKPSVVDRAQVRKGAD